MKKTAFRLLAVLLIVSLLAGCSPAESSVNPAPKNLRFVCPEPKVGTAVRDAEFSMTGQKAGTEYTLEWTVEYDGLHTEVMSEDDIFFASYMYSVKVQYEMDEDRTTENTTVELVSGDSGAVQTTTVDGTHWTTKIGFGTMAYEESMYIATSNPVHGVPAKDLCAYATLGESEQECTWKWAAIGEDGTEQLVKDTETLPEDAAKYTVYVSFRLPEGYTSENVLICIDPDADIGKIYTDEKGNTVVPISYENLLEESKTVVTIGDAKPGMTIAELAKTVEVTVDGKKAEVYDFFVGHGGVHFLDETTTLRAGTYEGRLNFEGKEEWGWTMSPEAMGLEISKGYEPEKLVRYAEANVGLWVTFTVQDDSTVVITMDIPKPGDTTADTIRTAKVTIDGEEREVYNLFWMYDEDNWLEEDAQITPGTYLGRLDFEGTENWDFDTEIDDLDLTMSEGYTATDLDLWAMLDFGVWFTFTVEGDTAASTVSTQEVQEEQTAGEKQREHIHEFSLTDAKNPTCTEEGYSRYTCACGEIYTETFPALGHEYTWVEDRVQWGQGTAVGTHHWECSRCGAVGESEAHDLQEIEPGHQQCTKCGVDVYSATSSKIN